jgi:probable rRNA maturation factor
MAIMVRIDRRAWKVSGGMDRLARRSARAALAAAGADPRSDLSITFASDRTIAGLNRRWRARNAATNVLSFPAPPRYRGGFLGDIVLAAGVIRSEAAQQGKSLSDHAAHLIVHGVLHLLGHDHHRSTEARRMERLEIRALETLGIADPYRYN